MAHAMSVCLLTVSCVQPKRAPREVIIKSLDLDSFAHDVRGYGGVMMIGLGVVLIESALFQTI